MKGMEKPVFHEPVMLSEVLEALETEKYAHLYNSCFIDATVGLGGHSSEFIKRNIFVIGIDGDVGSLEIADEVLKKACPAMNHTVHGCFKLLHGNFSELDMLVAKVYRGPVNGILFDLGISSFQLDERERGFSFQYPDSLLDMRLDRKNQAVKASDLLAVLDKKKLEQVFGTVLPRYLAAEVSLAVVKRRLQKPVSTVGDLLDVIKPIIRKKGKTDTATLPFMALRMAVNSEMENLEKGLKKALAILSPGGRLAVISFHSGEDRLVKNFFAKMNSEKTVIPVNKKPIIPGNEEVVKNPRSRSAKLRIIEKL